MVDFNGQAAPDPAGDDDLRLTLDASAQPGVRIKVIGVGGGGGNAINRMMEAGLDGVEFIAANTDAQALAQNTAPLKLQIGAKLTKGLGAGADPSVGRQAALEDTSQLIDTLDGADMVFVTTGLGGGTGTGAAPVIANLATELGALTVAVVTKPFAFEGKRRADQATRGLAELRKCVDTVVTIPNDRLLSTLDPTTSVTQAFVKADDVLRQAIQGISDLMLTPGLINLDFADVKTIMSGRGLTIMGTGAGHGESRAVDAVRQAITSPLLEDVSVDGAHGVLVNVTGGEDLTMSEVGAAASIIQEAVHQDANIVFGAVVDPTMDGEIKITVIATGFDEADGAVPHPASTADTPVDLDMYTGWSRDPSAAQTPSSPPHGSAVESRASGRGPADDMLDAAEQGSRDAAVEPSAYGARKAV